MSHWGQYFASLPIERQKDITKKAITHYDRISRHFMKSYLQGIRNPNTSPSTYQSTIHLMNHYMQDIQENYNNNIITQSSLDFYYFRYKLIRTLNENELSTMTSSTESEH
jgi:hypothetical protein